MPVADAVIASRGSTGDGDGGGGGGGGAVLWQS